MTVDKTEDIRRSLVSLAQATLPIPPDQKAANLGRTLLNVHIYGYSTGYNKCTTERFGITSARYQITGQRQFAIVAFDSLMDYSLTFGGTLTENEDLFDYLTKTMALLNDKTQLDVFKERVQAPIYRGTLKADQYMHVPLYNRRNMDKTIIK